MHNTRFVRGVVACAGALLTTSAFAGVVAPGLYELNNHPAATGGPPGYGLRLDDAIDATGDVDVVTFDFEADGAAMFMEYDGTSLRIFGMAYGGVVENGAYNPQYSGMVSIDFTYDLLGLAPGDDDFLVDGVDEANSGTVTLWDQTEIPIYDYSGNQGYQFRLGNEDDDQGHRGFDGISGWGWLNHTSPGNHVSYSDWIFTVGDVVPAPSALAVLAFGFVGTRRRRG